MKEGGGTRRRYQAFLRITWRRYRLLLYAGLIGVVGGLGAQLFVWLLDLGEHVLLKGIAGYTAPEAGVANPSPQFGPWGVWLIPAVTTLGGLVCGLLVYTFAPEAEGHGTDAAVAAFHYLGGRVRPIVPLVKTIASAITIGSGGAAGREGPTAQIAVGVGSIFADFLKLPDGERRIIVLAGMAAGLSAIFRSPLGMAIFAVEILYGSMAFEFEALPYTIIAAVVAYAVNGLFVGWSPIFYLPTTMGFNRPVELVGYAALGVVAGVVGAVEPPIFYGVRDLFKRQRIPNHIKPAIGGLLLGIEALLLPPVLGTGYGWVQMAINGDLVGHFLILLALAKILALSLTISSGGSGGVFGPNVYIGAMVGGWVASVVDALIPTAHLNPAAFVAVGMAAVFAGTARVPLATLIMVAEMTGGYGLIVPSMLATFLSFVVQQAAGSRAKYPRLYEAQVEDRRDSPVHHRELVESAFRLLQERRLADFPGVALPQLSDLVRFGRPIPIHSGKGSLLAIELNGPETPLIGETVAEALANRKEVVAVAILRGGSVMVPHGDTTLLEGDSLILAGSTEACTEIRDSVAGRGPLGTD